MTIWLNCWMAAGEAVVAPLAKRTELATVGKASQITEVIGELGDDPVTNELRERLRSVACFSTMVFRF